MLKNGDMTHYKKVHNKTTRLDEWVKTYYYDVLWQGGKGASLNKGIIESNDVRVRIPYTENDFSVGDIIVKGLQNDIKSQQELKDSYNITSIVVNDFSNLKHIHLEGK